MTRTSIRGLSGLFGGDGAAGGCSGTMDAAAEAEGMRLTPDVLMQQHSECKLMDETPSRGLAAVMVNCSGDIERVFVFTTKSKAGCERLSKD